MHLFMPHIGQVSEKIERLGNMTDTIHNGRSLEEELELSRMNKSYAVLSV